MNERRAAIAGGLLLGAAYFLWKGQNDFVSVDVAGGGMVQEAADMIGGAVSAATPYMIAVSLPGNAAYVARCAEVDQAYNLPAGMLERLAWQECRYRADIIEGRKVSSAGAKGMFQLMPMHWKFVDPLDWSASADYAGAMLARLYRRFGTWAKALAAYNWGEGNLNAKGLDAAPKETRDYYAQILADIGLEVVV